MQFAKYQALGNDYLVVERNDFAERLAASAIRRICDRHFGIGSDGILVREPSSDPAVFQLRILNPDGSEAEKSGNGLRIFARYLWDRRLVSDSPFQVVTPGGAVLCQVKEQGRSVTVEMGQVRFHSRDIPVHGTPRDVIRETIEVAAQALEFTAATIGRYLVRMLMARYAGFHQHMLVADGKAIEFYRKCGFERAGSTEPMWIYAGHDH